MHAAWRKDDNYLGVIEVFISARLLPINTTECQSLELFLDQIYILVIFVM